jgi:hypothetical protein
MNKQELTTLFVLLTIAVSAVYIIYHFATEEYYQMQSYNIFFNKKNTGYCVQGTGDSLNPGGRDFAELTFQNFSCSLDNKKFMITSDGFLQTKNGRKVYADKLGNDQVLKLSTFSGKRKDGRDVSDKFELTNDGVLRLKDSKYCVHPKGGYARNNVRLVLYDDCKAGDRIKFNKYIAY